MSHVNTVQSIALLMILVGVAVLLWPQPPPPAICDHLTLEADKTTSWVGDTFTITGRFPEPTWRFTIHCNETPLQQVASDARGVFAFHWMAEEEGCYDFYATTYYDGWLRSASLVLAVGENPSPPEEPAPSFAEANWLPLFLIGEGALTLLFATVDAKSRSGGHG